MSFNQIRQNVILIMMASILLAVFSVPALAEKETKTIAEGVAPVQGDNIAGARQKAVQDALRQAVEQVAGTMISATSIVKNDDLMERIYTNTQGYISQHQILKEWKDRNGLYRVKVQATVRTGVLRDKLLKLGILKAMMDYPRILILPYPQEDVSSAAETVETVLIKQFTDRRFDVVDPAKARELRKETKDLFKVDTVENVAARIGLKHHSEIVILYGVRADAAEFDGIMEQAPVSVRGRAVVTSTAKILTAQQQNVTGMGKTPELARQNGAKRAAEKIAQPMIQMILSWWADYTANGIPFIVTLHSPARADQQIIAFQKAVESIPGVVALSERSSGGGITEMMVKYKGNSVQFKRGLLSALYGVDGFKDLHAVASKGRFLVFSVN